MIKVVNFSIAALLDIVVLICKIIIKMTVIALLLMAIFGGLPTTWGTLEVDVFPVGVYLR